MKKRLLCLFLCLIMLLSVVLTGCSNSEEEDDGTEDKEGISDDASASAMTLSMWIVSEEKIDDKVASDVTLKLNEITESKFKTRLSVHYLTEDEYRVKLEQAIVDYEAAKKQEAATETETTLPVGEDAEDTVVTDETETNEIGMTVIKYPDELKNQVDIIYITGEDMYVDFIEAGWLAPLDSELENASKKISEYVSATLLNSAKHNGTTYAIPNNHAIGQYTYMLLNKSLMQKYSQQGYVQTGQITSFYSNSLQSFLSLVTKIEDPEQVVAIDNKVYGTTDEETANAYDYCLNLLAHYWSIDPETYDMLQDFSVIGHQYQTDEELSRGSTILGYESLFENADFRENYLKINKFRYNGYFDDAEGRTAAVKFMTGDYSVQTKFDANGDCIYVMDGVEYYPVVVEYPTATSYDIYGNMFGVYSNSLSTARSMEIVTYLNTNSDFRNLLQYGIQGTHYELVKNADGITSVKYLNDKYSMDIFATGNVFIAYPEPEMSADIWESGKAQNRYSLVDPLLGFDFAGHAATTAPVALKETIDNKNGYNLSYATGYSKDVLSQNEDLKAWLEASDEAGAGIYVYETVLSDGQNRTYTYYIYKNKLTTNVDFDVVVDRVLETKEVDGEMVTTQTKLDFILTYADGEGASESGYELSTMRIYTRRTNSFQVLASVNDSAPSTDGLKKETVDEKYVNFDFFNTDEYTIEVYDSLTKATVLKNTTLTSWIALCDKDKSANPTSYVLKYTDPETKVATFVIYRTGLMDKTYQTLQPTGDSGELNLNVQYTFEPGYELLATERNYLLYYIRVTPRDGVDLDINYNIFSNGDQVEVPDKNVLDYISDPDFEIVGNLDTELVKYLARLNERLSAKLNACEDYETFEQIVDEMALLLCTDEDTKLPAITSFTHLRDVATEFAVNNSLEQLKKNLQSATSYEIIKNMVEDKEAESEDGEPVMVEAKYKDTNGKEEEYVYFDSPYGIYYSWMRTYGYLPSTKK